MALRPGEELHVVSDGDIRWADLLLAMAERAGPGCRLRVSTLAAHRRDVDALAGAGSLDTLLVCYAVLRMNRGCERSVTASAAGRLRMARSHAKFALAEGGALDLACLSTANLNRNIRAEHFLITTDPVVVGHLGDVLDDLHAHGDEPGRPGGYYGETFEKCLGGMAGPTPDIGLAEAVGRWRV